MNIPIEYLGALLRQENASQELTAYIYGETDKIPVEEYDRWVDECGFNTSHEQAAADAANRHAPEDWITRSHGRPAPSNLVTYYDGKAGGIVTRDCGNELPF